MKSGKLDEEFKRMNNIVDKLTSNSMLLLNESFAATNEREGSEIARQIISALLEKNVNIFFVTHLYEFAHYFHKQKMENVIFLCAERLKDGKRTFKIIEGEPLETSFGEDLYKKVFEDNV
jgi:DNA mismatch repair ATPase MutS